MRGCIRESATETGLGASLFLMFLMASANVLAAQQPPGTGTVAQGGNGSSVPEIVCEPAKLGSPYIPVDSWIYPAMTRLYALGYLDALYLGLRPWTRLSVMHMLEEAGDLIENGEAAGDPGASQAREIYNAIDRELRYDMQGPCGRYKGGARVESAYTIVRSISGTPLHDSYHIGSTIVNDYGRPFENGVNNYSGASGYATLGRFAFYARVEFQFAPSASGYSGTLAQTLSNNDEIPYFMSSPTPPYGPTTIPYDQPTIPQGPIETATNGRLMEGYVSYQYLNHVFSFGRQDQWLGPAQGSSMAFSNNAQNFYAFEINRIEPLQIPLLSRVTGPFRYEFIYGALRGHTFVPNPQYQLTPSPDIANVINPGDPWLHVEKVSFKPLKDLEFGFERTVIFGGEGHSPVTIHGFLKSFFSLQNVTAVEKNGRDDPGARFGAFDFTWRLPYMQKWLTLYCDSEAHDDVSPISAPRRAAYRPGLYLSHVPGAPKFDLRAEGISTDPPTSRSNGGIFMYYEGIQKQGYTNEGQLFGDWIGREDKGGQAWATYHLSGNEWIQAGFRHQKAAKDFIPGGTTLNDFNVQVVKRITKDIELDGNFTIEHWKAPVYLPGDQTVTTTNIQLTWFPPGKKAF